MCCFGENIKKTSSVKRHCGALCFQNKCFLLSICFFIIHFVFFFPRLLQASASDYLPAEVEHLSEKDIQKVTYEEMLSEMPSEKQRETMEKDVINTRDKIEYLCRQDSPKRRLIDKIDQIERMTDEKFKAVFDAFRQATGKSQRHNDEQGELRGKVQKRFNEHRVFIRTNFHE